MSSSSPVWAPRHANSQCNMSVQRKRGRDYQEARKQEGEMGQERERRRDGETSNSGPGGVCTICSLGEMELTSATVA